MNTVVTIDSVGDLNAELISRYNFKIIPLIVTLGEVEFKDGVNISIEQIFDYVDKQKELPKTSAVSVQDYIDVFTELLNTYDSIIHFTVSGDLSVSYNNALLASKEFDGKVFVVDSRSLSTGISLLAIKAHDDLQRGNSASEVAKNCQSLSSKVQASFVIDNLKFLHKGGRCSALALFGANILKIRPKIEVANGKLIVGKKYQGKYEKVIEKYVDDVLEKYPDYDKERVFITHTPISEDIVKSVHNKLVGKFDEIIETNAGATITCHCGKHTLGILFLNK